jgi:CubicO group peptidase (beta-lactamase class C family)
MAIQQSCANHHSSHPHAFLITSILSLLLSEMYTLAAHIVSQLTATPFAEYVTRNIISPLGLSSTTYNISQTEHSGKLVDGFVDTGKDEKKGEGRGKLRFRPVRYWNWERSEDLSAGAGGVISSATDMVCSMISSKCKA